jgi:beta-glucosidase
MFRDAAAQIKEVKPSAKVLSVEALPWWKHGSLDPGGLLYNTVMHANFDHLDRIYDVCDIIGFNYYYSQTAGPISFLSEGSRHGHNFTMMGWRIDPEALGKQIRYVGKRYDKPMMITENGIATRNDSKRVWYIRNHIAAIGRAIRCRHAPRRPRWCCLHQSPAAWRCSVPSISPVVTRRVVPSASRSSSAPSSARPA